MTRSAVVFADNGGKLVRGYGGAQAGEQVVSWRGMCVDARARSGLATEHVFADGTDLLRDPPVPLGAAVVARARALLAAQARPPAPSPETDRALRDLAERRQVSLTWASVRQHVAVGDAGRLAHDDRVLCTVEVSADSRPACAETVRWDMTGTEASLRQVAAAADRVSALAARPVTEPPPGCDLLLQPGLAGSFFHELLGHPLEADVVAAGASYLSDRFGEAIAPSWLSVTDGPPPGGDGLGASIDDEGTPIATVQLIGAGRVRGALRDRLSAELSGRASTGHGRRLDYRHPVIPRMWHTVARSDVAAEQPPGSVRLAPRGLRLRRMNLLTGDFEFTADTASLDAGTGPPHRTGPCTVTGNALTVLAALRPGQAECLAAGRATRGCGKLGQFPLVTTFENSGLWIPSEAVRVRSDTGV